MKYFLLNIVAILLSAQRYTGYGRGYDWGRSSYNVKFDAIFFLVIFLIIIVGGSLLLLMDKIKTAISPISKLPTIYNFKKKYKYCRRGCVVNNDNGDYFDVCIFTDENGINYYVGFSSYMEPLTCYDIIEKEKDLHLRFSSKGGFLICTKESENYRINDKDSSAKHQKEIETVKMLYDINYRLKEQDYTITIL